METLQKNKIKLSVIILMLGCFYSAFEFFDFQEGALTTMQKQLKKIADETSKIESDVVRIREFASNIPAVKQSFREQSLQLEAVLESIPRTFEFNQLLNICNQIAMNSGVSIVKFKPILGNQTQEREFFKRATIDLVLSGNFISTMVFMDQMNKIKRLISFKEVEMVANRGNADDKTKSRSLSLDISMVIEAYSLGET